MYFDMWFMNLSQKSGAYSLIHLWNGLITSNLCLIYI